MGVILNVGQERIRQEAVNWFFNSSEQVFEFAGEAGTGKTVLIYEILKSLGLKSYQYMPMAYTGKAAIVMRTRGFITARSIHSSLYEVVEVPDTMVNTMYGIPLKKKEFKKKTMIDPNVCLFFIDEAWMVPKHMVKDILSFGVKVIVCGDFRQLPPVGDDPGFLTGSNVRYLTEKMRQAENNPIIYLADRATKGLPIHNGMYGNNVLVANDDEFCPEMVGYADCILCGTNRTRDIMNKYVRQLARFTSEVPVLGERVICRNNNWDIAKDGISLANGLDGTVVSYPDPSCFNGKTFKFNFMLDIDNIVFYDIMANYQYFIATFDEKQSLKEYGNRRYLEGEFFEFAYALTVHLYQGSECRRGIYIEEFLRPQLQNALDYTGITRFKEGMIYLKRKNKYVYIPQNK